MYLKEYIEQLDKNAVKYKLNEPLSKYGAYGVGGNATVMVFPSDKEQFAICTACDNYAVIGKGTNVLFSDYGFDGAVVNTVLLSDVCVSGLTVTAECGAPLAKVREAAELNCLSGLEFTEGIPASVGGAVCMNAGCYSKSVGDLVAYVITNKSVYNNVNCNFGYRTSAFADAYCGEAIYKVCFLLKPGESDLIEGKKEHYRKLRKNSQPVGKSCGSVFLNDGYFAGKVIDTAGLKGCRIGGAYVSQKHANFIINEGASAGDIYRLIAYIKQKVYCLQNIKLKEEIKFIGRFDD